MKTLLQQMSIYLLRRVPFNSWWDVPRMNEPIQGEYICSGAYLFKFDSILTILSKKSPFKEMIACKPSRKAKVGDRD